jgi:hypothetical protein
MLKRGVAGVFVKASSITIKHGLTQPSAEVADMNSADVSSSAVGHGSTYALFDQVVELCCSSTAVW